MSILAVTAPAARRGLTTVATVTRELGITGSADHDFLEDLILQASAAIEGWCRRTFTREDVSETFRPRPNGQCCIWPAGRTSPSYRLSRMARFRAGLWELDAASGELWRLDDADRRVAWPAAKIVVAYAAGYVLSRGPRSACLETVKGPLVCPLARSPDQGRAGPRDRLGRLLGAVHRRRRSRPAARRHRALATLLPAHGLRTIAMLNPGQPGRPGDHDRRHRAGFDPVSISMASPPSRCRSASRP